MSTAELSRIAQLLREAYDGIPWYGTALRKLLNGVSAEAASAKPIAGVHTINQEVLHVIAWRKFATRLLSGEFVSRMSDDENWPTPAECNVESWQQTLEELAQTQIALEAAIAGLSDDRLSENAPGQKFSFYRLLHGVIQHDAYHAGQIALLRNAAK
jgi:uncharacterized damage-inducible protein DinB